MQVTFFLNCPMFNLLFYCNIILYWQKVTFYDKFSHNLTLEVQILWKNCHFTSAISKCWKIVEFPKILIKMENFKTRYEAQTASRLKESIYPLSHPPSQPDKILLRFWNAHTSLEKMYIYIYIFVKWVRLFEWNCIVKWVIFFISFCWLWDFLMEN